VAKAMMMGIISDTLYFRSPTTTQYDKDIFDELNKIAQIENTEQFSLDMFAAKSDLGDIHVRDLVTLDYKVFESGGKRFGIGTVETTNPSYTLGRKQEILDDLINLKQEQQLDMVMLSVVDILNEQNTTLVPTNIDADIIKNVFGSDTVDNLADLGNRISRKKQLAGPVTDYFA
jgi:manganese-dependent inorganic pyrophosphatase